MSAVATLLPAGKWLLLSGAYVWGQGSLWSCPIGVSPGGYLPGDAGMFAPVSWLNDMTRRIGETNAAAFSVKKVADAVHMCCSGLTVHSPTATTSPVSYMVGPIAKGVGVVHIRPLLTVTVSFSASLPGVQYQPYELVFPDDVMIIL